MRFTFCILAIAMASFLLPPQVTLQSVDAATIQVPGQFATIQETIDYANPGDTIRVSPGTYFERLTINKALRLVGETRESTIIDGGGSSPVILVTAGSVEIRGFTIRNAGGFYPQGIFVREVALVNITSNTISASTTAPPVEGDGVTLQNAHNNMITDNIFQRNLYAVNVTDSNFNLIARNTATSGTVGVQLWNSRGNIVANNTFSRGESGADVYFGSTQNTIVGNILKDNILTGIDVADSQENTIIENNFQFNRRGINIQNAQGNIFYHNNILSSLLSQVNHVDPSDLTRNTWDNGTAGNYWDDYTGQDLDGDGVGDTNRPHQEVDNYPLTSPFIPIPLAVRALADPLSGEAPLTVTFNANVLGGRTPYVYSWDFGDGERSSSAVLSHTYELADTYSVTLQVIDAVGAEEQSTVSVTVNTPQPRQSSNLPYYVGGAGLVFGVAFGLFIWSRMRKRRIGMPRPGVRTKKRGRAGFKGSD